LSLLSAGAHGRTDSVLQFLTVVIIFILVLGMTYLATRWIAGYEKGKLSGTDVEVIETCRIAPNKYVQVLRIGSRYVAVALCKDTVSFLTDLSPEDLTPREETPERPALSFKEILSTIKERGSGGKPETDDNEKN